MRRSSLFLLGLVLSVGCGGLAERGSSEAQSACETGTTRARSCGKNGRGELREVCLSGAWTDGDCTDPDECTDGEVGQMSCPEGSGTRACVAGTWVNGACGRVDSFLISQNGFGAPGADDSFSPSISADGTLVAFHSFANDLVDGDTNDFVDIFVRDLASGTTRRISVDSAGAQGNGNSFKPRISADGRLVVFYSDATNLVLGDTNGAQDVFLYELASGLIRRVSVTSNGIQGDANSATPSISGDGRIIAFRSLAGRLAPNDGPAPFDIFAHDMQSGSTRRIADGNTADPQVSPDGRFVAYSSINAKLVSGDTNMRSDVFVYDLTTEQTRIVSVNDAGTQGNEDAFGPSISVDGKFVAYHSFASNLVNGDTNGAQDVFVHDLTDGTTRRVSVSATGEQGNGDSTYASITPDGRFVAFTSAASNLVAGDTNGMPDVFVSDLVTGAVRCASLNAWGAPANDEAGGASITPDGNWLAFHSRATDLMMSIDANSAVDIFVRPLR